MAKCPQCKKISLAFRAKNKLLTSQLKQLQEEFGSRNRLFEELRELRAWKHEYDMKRLSPPKKTLWQRLRFWEADE